MAPNRRDSIAASGKSALGAERRIGGGIRAVLGHETREEEEEPSIMSEGASIIWEQQRRRGSPDGWVGFLLGRRRVVAELDAWEVQRRSQIESESAALLGKPTAATAAAVCARKQST